MNRDLNELAIFLAVAEEGSLVRAAAALHMPRSTVSKKLADLEKRLAQPLFKRTTRRVALTQAGRLLMIDVQRGIRLLNVAENRLIDDRNNDWPTIIISAPPLLAQNILGTVAAEAIREHPRLRVAVRSSLAFDPVADTDIDIRLSAHPVGRPPEGAKIVAYSRRAIYAAPAWLITRSHPKQPSDIEPEDITMRNPVEALEMRREKHRATLHCAGPLVCVDHETVRDATIAGLGFGVLPRFLAAPHVMAGKLVGVLDDWEMPSIPIAASLAAHAQGNLLADTIIQLLPRSLERAGFTL